MPNIAYIGIGSNLGPSIENCKRAVETIQSHPHITLLSRSSFYRSEPVGVKDQDWFVNAAIKIQTTLQPGELLQALLDIERKMGRERREKWESRIIDLDILFYGDLIMASDDLKLPHPEIAGRRFVLEPLLEIASDYNHPALHKTISELLAELALDQKVHRISGS